MYAVKAFEDNVLCVLFQQPSLGISYTQGQIKNNTIKIRATSGNAMRNTNLAA